MVNITREQAMEELGVNLNSGLSPEFSVSPRKTDFSDNTNTQEIGAAFRVDNDPVSLMVDETNGVDNTVDPEFDLFAELSGTEYESNPEYFENAFNHKYLDALKIKYKREKEDRKILERGGWSAMGWQFLAGMLSPTNLIPGGLAAKGAKQGFSIAKSAGSVGTSGLLATTASEAALQSSQGLRTAEESLLNIAFGTALSAGFGGGLALMANKGIKGKIARKFDEASKYSDEFRTKLEGADLKDQELQVQLSKEADELIQEGKIKEIEAAAKLSDEIKARYADDAFDAELDELLNDARSVNRQHSLSAASDVPTIDDLTIYGRAAGATAKATKFFNPILRSLQSPSPHARRIAGNLFENPLMMKMNDYADSPSALETKIKLWTEARLAETIRKMGTSGNDGIYNEMRKAGHQMTRSDFRKQITKAMRRNDGKVMASGQDTGIPSGQFNPYVVKAAKVAREELFEHAREELNKVGFQLDSKGSKTADSYLTRVWNNVKLLQGEQRFKARNGHVWNYVKNAIDFEIADAAKKFEKQIDNIEREISDLKLNKLRRQSEISERKGLGANELHEELNKLDNQINALQKELEGGELTVRSDYDLDGIKTASTAEGKAHIEKYGAVGSKNWAQKMAAEARRSKRKQISVKAQSYVPRDEVDKLFEDASRILPDGIEIRLVDEIAGGKAKASFSSDLQLLKIANDVVNKGQSLRHEAVHILRDRFTDQEWSSLVDAARKSELLYDEPYLKAYEGRDNLDDLIDQEHVAKLVEYAHQGGNISHLDPQVQTIIQRILETLKALAKSLTNPEFKNVAKIIDDLEQGKIAKRDPKPRSEPSDEQFNLREDYDHGFGLNSDEYLSLLRRHPMKAMFFHSIDEGKTWHDPAGLVQLHKQISETVEAYSGDFYDAFVRSRISDEISVDPDQLDELVTRYIDDPESLDETIWTKFDKLDNDHDAIVSRASSEGSEAFEDGFEGFADLADAYRDVSKIERFLAGLPEGTLSKDPSSGQIQAPSINPYGRTNFTAIERAETSAGAHVSDLELKYGEGKAKVYEGGSDLEELYGIDEGLEIFGRGNDNPNGPADFYMVIARDFQGEESVGAELVDFQVGSKQGEQIIYSEEPELLFENILDNLEDSGYIIRDADDELDFGIDSNSVFEADAEILKAADEIGSGLVFVDGKYYNKYGSIDFIKNLPEDPEFQIIKSNAKTSENFDLLSRHDPEHVLKVFSERDTFEQPLNKALLGRVLDEIKGDESKAFETLHGRLPALEKIEKSDEVFQLGDNASKAKSTSDSLTGTHIEAPDDLYNWLGVKPAKFQADYTKIAKKRAKADEKDPLSDPKQVRNHVEHVLSNAPFAFKHRRGNMNLISIDGQGRLVSVDLEISKTQYKVITAHRLTSDELEVKIRGAFEEHGEDGFKWKADPRKADQRQSISGVPQEDPSFVTRSSVNDPLSVDDIIKRVRYLQGFQGRGAHPSVYSIRDRAELKKQLNRLNVQRDQVLNQIDRVEAGEELPPDVTPLDVQAMLDIVTSNERPKMPETLVKFLQRNGGLLDEGNELAGMGLTPKTHPKLVRSAVDAIHEPGLFGNVKKQTGARSFDDAGLIAWEEGFFTSRPTVAELLDAIRNDIGGEAVVRDVDVEQLYLHQDVIAVEDELARLGIDPKKPRAKFSRTSTEDDIVQSIARVLDARDDEKVSKLEAKRAKLETAHNEKSFAQELDPEGHVDEIVNSIFNKLTNREFADDVSNENIIDYGFLKGRTFGIRDELVEEFLEDDIEHIMRRYTRNVAGQIEMKKRFGNIHLNNHFAKISDEFSGLREEINYSDKSPKEKEKALKKLDSQERDVIRSLKFARDKILGRYEHDLDSSGWARSVDAALSWKYMTSLGGVLLTSSLDVWRHPMSQGFGRIFGKQLPALIAGNKGLKMNRELARKYAGIAEVIHNSRLAHMAGLSDPYSVSTPGEIAIQKMTDRFSKLTGLPYWNQFHKEFAGAVVIDRIVENMVKGIDNINQAEVRWMHSLGLGDMATGAKYLQNAGALEKVQGLWTVNPDKMQPEVAQRFFAGVKKEIDTVIISKGIGDAPLWTETKIGRIASQFKSFGAASHQRMLLRGMQDDTGRFVGGLAGMVTSGMFVYMLKQLEAGRDIDDKPSTWLVEGLDRSGAFFLFFEANNIWEKAGGFGVYQALGAKDPASRFASRNTVGAALGPLFGSANDLLSVLGNGARLLNPNAEFDPTAGDVKSLRRLAPYATLPYWRWLVDGYIVPAMQDEVR